MSWLPPFRRDATPSECLLEIISNQLQLASRQSLLDRVDKAASAPVAQLLETQIEGLVARIIEQRDFLKITVKGV
jgi:hypothetical protein